jgi:hypothetical protein
MSEHYIKLRTKNAKMLMLYGDKLTPSEWLRKARTNGLHTEVQHSDRYGSISNSCTLSDGCNGGRMKPNRYSHGYRWSTLYIPVTAEQEALIWTKGCEMAGLDLKAFTEYIHEGHHQDIYEKEDLNCFYGPNHVKYDKGAAFFSFISKRNVWKPSKTKMICNRYCAELLLVVWPDLLDIKKEDACVTVTMHMELDAGGEWSSKESKRLYAKLDPATLTPDQFEYMVRHYFYQEINDEATQE